MKKLMLLSAVLLGAAAASQAGVSVHVDLPLPPLPHVVIGHRPPPVYVEHPRPVCPPPRHVYVPPPVVCAPPPVVCEPRRVYVPAPTVVVQPRHPHRYMRNHGYHY